MPWKPDWRSGWYLYRSENAFFKSIEVSRPPKVSDPVHVEVTAELRVHDGAFPSRLQVDLELSANEEQALKFRVELIGVFSLIEKATRASRLPEGWLWKDAGCDGNSVKPQAMETACGRGVNVLVQKKLYAAAMLMSSTAMISMAT